MKSRIYRWRIFNARGELLCKEEAKIDINPYPNHIVRKIRWRPSPFMEGNVALVYVELLNPEGSMLTDHLYTFAIRNEVSFQSDMKCLKTLLKGLLNAKPTELEIDSGFLKKNKDGWEHILEIKNKGTNNALFVKLDSEMKEDYKVYFNNNYFFLLSEESRRVKAEKSV